MATTINAQITGYGWPDNDPPGAAIAFPGKALHDRAGGTGTYADPITFAGDPADTPVGTIIYVPTLQKYFIMEDTCASAMASKSDAVWVDIWVGGTASDDANAIYDAQAAITNSSTEIIIDPAPNLTVSSTPLFGGGDPIVDASTDTGSSDFADTQPAPGTSGSDTVTGTAGNDTVLAGDGDDFVLGGAGDDQILGGGGDDTMAGGEGNDEAFGGEGNDAIAGGAGNDMLGGVEGSDQLFGAEDDDAVYGGDDNDLAYGGSGNDDVYGGSGADTLGGGEGDDEIGLGIGDDEVAAGAGNDTVYGADGNDTIFAVEGADSVFGGSGDDVIYLGNSGGTPGDGAQDVYNSSADNGDDIVYGFEDGTDLLNLTGSGFGSFDDLSSRIGEDADGNVTIDLGNDDVLTLIGVRAADIDQSDFQF